jgi:hypothetical protein
MTVLEEIKKALEGVGPLKVEFTPDCDEFNAIIAPINDDYDGTFFTVIGCGDKQDKLGGFMAIAVNAVPELLSTLESLQRENDMLRASRDGYAKQRDEILRLYNEERLAWSPMDSAPKDGKHCILSIPSGGFAYTVQGAFMGGKWINALNVDAEPLAWMPNVMLPDAYCPWKRPFSVPLASTGGEHHADK